MEGRNRETLLEILQYLKETNQVKFSVEVEKVNRGFEDFIPYADIVFVSKDVAQAHGLMDKDEAVKYFMKLIRPDAGVVVAWGDKGAAAFHPDTGPVSSPAEPPQGGVVDTLGAGDTFNAAVLGCLAAGLPLDVAVGAGCRVAGEKVGFRGFSGLKGASRKWIQEMVAEKINGK